MNRAEAEGQTDARGDGMGDGRGSALRGPRSTPQLMAIQVGRHVCPNCRSTVIDRSRQGLLERLVLRVLKRRPYRCRRCRHRFYDRAAA
jgi:hypothetical protein